MIRVLHLITGLNVGGAETLLLNLILRSDRTQFSHRVISLLETGPIAEPLVMRGVQVDSLGMRRGRPSLSALYRLVRALKRSEPDLLYCWMYHANLLGLIAAKLAGVRRIAWSIHSGDRALWNYRTLTGWVVRASAALSSLPDCIVFGSHQAMELHEAHRYDISRAVLIFSGFNAETFKPDAEARRSVREELGLNDETIVIGMIARWDPMKDHANFLRAAGILSRREPMLRYVLAGLDVTDQNSALARLIRENALAGRVHLLGLRRDVAQLNAAFDIGCLSSTGESFPNVLGEAMACGLPCVVTDSGAAHDIVGDTGRVVPVRNSEALALALRELVCMGTDERRSLGQRARERVKERFSLDRFVEDFEGLCRRLVISCTPCGIQSSCHSDVQQG